MKITRISNTHFYVDISCTINKQIIRKRFRFKSSSKREAKDIGEKLLVQMKDELKARTNHADTTFKSFSKYFYENHAKINNKPSTLISKNRIMKRYINPYFGNMLLKDITNKDIAEFKKILREYTSERTKKRLSAKTINNILAVIKKILNFAMEMDYIKSVPVVKFLRVERREMRALEETEINQILRAADQPWKNIIFLAVKTGMRKGELLALHWEDVDFNKKIIHVTKTFSGKEIRAPKGYKQRDIPIGDATMMVLNNLWEERRSAYVFSDSQGLPFEPTKAAKGLYAACDRAGMKRVGYHIFRHSFVTTLGKEGVDPNVIQNLAGHADIRTTFSYWHSNKNDKIKAIDVLDQKHDIIFAPAISTNKSLNEAGSRNLINAEINPLKGINGLKHEIASHRPIETIYQEKE